MKLPAGPSKSFPEPTGRSGAGGWRRWLLQAACLVGLTLAVSSCTVLRRGTAESTTLLKSLTGTGGTAGVTNLPTTLQFEVMREADQFVASVAQATDEFTAAVGTLDARDMAQQWKLNLATAAYINATGENPARNAVGMVVLATISRMVVEDYWVGQRFGDAARPLLETQRRLETNAWGLMNGVLTPEQQGELHKLLVRSREENPNQRHVTVRTVPELGVALSRVPVTEQGRRSANLFSLLYLNPLAGLDPATQAIEQTRLLAQRAMFYAQRAPMLLGWQVELTTYQLAAQPESRQVLSNLNEVSGSTTVFAQTAEGLPRLVNDQREAAIAQLLAGVAAERTNLLAALDSQEARLRGLLPEVRSTLTAGGDMASSVNGAVKSLDSFVRLVNPPETNAPVAATNSRPFDVLDYGKAAGQIGAAAVELNTLLGSVNQSLPSAAQLGQQAGAEARAVVDHAFRLGLLLIAVAGVVAVLVVWVSHQLRRRTTGAPVSPQA